MPESQKLPNPCIAAMINWSDSAHLRQQSQPNSPGVSAGNNNKQYAGNYDFGQEMKKKILVWASTAVILPVVCGAVVTITYLSTKWPTKTGGTIEIQVPEQTSLMYLVPIQQTPPADPVGALKTAIGEKMRGSLKQETIDLLNNKQIEVTVRKKKDLIDLPYKFFELMGTAKGDLQKLQECEMLIAINGYGKPGWPPRYEFCTRGAAASLAAMYKAPVADMSATKLLSADQASAILPADGQKPRYADWLTSISSESETGMWLTTKGMYRVGLPELQAVDAPPQLDRALPQLITGLGWKLCQIQSEQLASDRKANFKIPSEIEVATADIEQAYGEPINGHGKASVHLRMEKSLTGSEDFLTIETPADSDKDNGEYLTEICIQLFGQVPGKIVNASSDDPKLQKAIAEAKDSFQSVRKKALSGKLPLGYSVSVKYPIQPESRATEYIWASITDWSSDSQVKGFVENDVYLDPTIKPGQKVVIKTISIVDWIIRDSHGAITEGGFTQKVLTQK
ncbi:MAG: DUF2314 domain-containing protein [Cyanobacteria bacterium SZAS TMP-1]|nr:DUF2314 domain-containing protein [Cyanobacteria bacterium SZAS TMP-1]